MAYFLVNLYSNSLMRAVQVHVVLPTDKRTKLGQPAAPQKFPVLYLLHGILGNDMDWQTNTTIGMIADRYNLCVVMPAGENKFYSDSARTGEYFGTFLREELPDFIERTFPVSEERDQTFLAGLSMGGFGALLNGLKAPEKFGYIGAFSAALEKDLFLATKGDETPSMLTEKQIETFFDIDSPAQFEGCPSDYEYAARHFKGPKPKIWMACGRQDTLYKPDFQFAELLKEEGFDVTWDSCEGQHEWKVWQYCIDRFIPWLPLKEAEAGVSSGNVKGE